MRIYRDCDEAIVDIGRELKKCSTYVHTQTYQNKDIRDDENFNTREIQAFQFMILDCTDKDFMPNATVEWAKAEFNERISRTINPGEAWLLRKDVWEQFLVDKEEVNEEGDVKIRKVFDYTYSERIYPQLQRVINELRERPQTRQAIISLHNSHLDCHVMGKNRVPCSMYYQYMIRDGKLDVIYVMRSSDFATHFQNDIWLADELRNYIAKMIGLKPGKFIMMVDSLHIYKKDWDELTNY